MTTFDSNYAYNMATQLAGFDTQTSYSRLDRNKKNYQAQQTALNTLSSALSTFQTKLSGLKGTGSTNSMVQNKATLSSSDYATATVGGKAVAGSYQFFVKQLASKDQVALQGLNDSTTGTRTVGQPGNTEATAFEVNPADYATLGELAAAINAKAKDSKVAVNATLVRSGTTTSLVLTSENPGENQKISLMLEGQDEAATKTTLGSKQLSTAQDAVVYMGASEAEFQQHVFERHRRRQPDLHQGAHG
jgi:flagellar hook-associated protein 2